MIDILMTRALNINIKFLNDNKEVTSELKSPITMIKQKFPNTHHSTHWPFFVYKRHTL